MGIIHVAGVTGGTGDTYQPEDVLKQLALIEEANDPEGATAPFLFPVTRGAMGSAIPKELAGLPVLTTTQVSKTRQKGGGLRHPESFCITDTLIAT